MKTITTILSSIFIVIVFAVAFLFIIIGLVSLDNSLTVAAAAAMGSALLVFIILITLGRVESLLEVQNKTLKEQNQILRYIAKQRREDMP